jgi:hypothetical protein
MRDEHTRVPATIRVDTDDRLSLEVLGDVRHEPVLADNNNDVVRSEQEAIEVCPFHTSPPPVERDRPGHGSERSLIGTVALIDLLQRPAPGS